MRFTIALRDARPAAAKGGFAAREILVCGWLLDASFWDGEAAVYHFPPTLSTSMGALVWLLPTHSSCLAIALHVFLLA